MQAYLNIQDWSNALRICRAYNRNPKGFYDIHDYIQAKQYVSEFMKEIWNIVKKCEVSLKEAFSLIRWNTAAITTKTLEILKSWLKPKMRSENSLKKIRKRKPTNDVKESYWRTVHAASLLKNWAIASDIVNTHCKMYADLEKECFEQKVSS